MSIVVILSASIALLISLLMVRAIAGSRSLAKRHGGEPLAQSESPVRSLRTLAELIGITNLLLEGKGNPL